jgi:hypothetical protein
LSQKHFLRELRNVDFAANTTIRFSELIWEEILGDQKATLPEMDVVTAGIKAGLKFVDANGEAIGEFVARTGTGTSTLI